ncbi:MAG: hypothetical protein E7453_02740 [Ruminococcaceae bacterium]|nr:hypothetical protein [Oscillospiraceae bacterium]
MLFGKKLKKFDPKKEQSLRDEIEANGGLEKNDLAAMIISALLVLLPVGVIILVILAVFAFLFF